MKNIHNKTAKLEEVNEDEDCQECIALQNRKCLRNIFYSET